MDQADVYLFTSGTQAFTASLGSKLKEFSLSPTLVEQTGGYIFAVVQSLGEAICH